MDVEDFENLMNAAWDWDPGIECGPDPRPILYEEVVKLVAEKDALVRALGKLAHRRSIEGDCPEIKIRAGCTPGSLTKCAGCWANWASDEVDRSGWPFICCEQETQIDSGSLEVFCEICGRKSG